MTQPTTARHDLTIWRNDDYYAYPIRVVGLDLTGTVLAMEVRLGGDVTGAPLIALPFIVPGTGGATNETQGIQFRGKSVVDGVEVSNIVIRMDRPTLQALPYAGERGDAAEFEYALVIGGRTRLTGRFILPAHVYKSDAAPANRPSSYGASYAHQGGSPDSGASLVVSLDGGVTVLIDGADVVSGAIGRSEDAAARAEAAAIAFLGADKVVSGYDIREDIPIASRPYGLRRRLANAYQDNAGNWVTIEWEWTKNDLTSAALAGPGRWATRLTEGDLLNRANHTGLQDQSTIGGLPQTLAAQAAALATLSRDVAYRDTAITAFTASPAIAELGTTVNAVTFHLEESGTGPFAKVITRGDGQTVWWLKSASHDAIAYADATISTDLLTGGDSLMYDVGPTAANAAGLNLANPTAALYSQTIRKLALRLGVFPIALTLAGNMLPVSGAAGTVTAINGQPTNYANPDAFLHASGVDTDTHAMTGLLAGRQVTITYNPVNLDTYSIAQANGAAVAVPAGSIFVPDFAAMMTSRELWLMPGHNSQSLSSPAASYDEIRTTIDAIMAKRGTNRTLLMPFWLAESELSLLPLFNDLRAYLRRTYPGAYVVDAQGRDPYEMLLGNSTADDRARGLVSAALRRDDLHPNATGIGLIKDQIVYFRSARMTGTMALVATTDFTLAVNGKTRTASVQFVPRRFWGVSASDALTKAQVIALPGGELSLGRAKAFTVNPAAQYVYVAYLASLGDPPGFKIGGFNEQYVKTIVSVTTAAGLTADYIVLRSLNKLTGAVSVEVQ